mgnify:CR=1 FL=1
MQIYKENAKRASIPPIIFPQNKHAQKHGNKSNKKNSYPHPPTHTEPGIDLKLLTRQPGRLPIGGYLGGVITHDGEGHYSFVESAGEGRWIPQQRNPHIYEGRFVNVNRRPDGTLYPSLTRPPYTEVFTFRHFCLAAAEELRMVADMIG